MNQIEAGPFPGPAFAAISFLYFLIPLLVMILIPILLYLVLAHVRAAKDQLIAINANIVSLQRAGALVAARRGERPDDDGTSGPTEP